MNDLESTGPSVAEVKATPLTTEQAQLSDARKNLLGALPDAFNKDYKDLLKGPDVQAAQGYRLEVTQGDYGSEGGSSQCFKEVWLASPDEFKATGYGELRRTITIIKDAQGNIVKQYVDIRDGKLAAKVEIGKGGATNLEATFSDADAAQKALGDKFNGFVLMGKEVTHRMVRGENPAKNKSSNGTFVDIVRSTSTSWEDTAHTVGQTAVVEQHIWMDVTDKGHTFLRVSRSGKVSHGAGLGYSVSSEAMKPDKNEPVYGIR